MDNETESQLLERINKLEDQVRQLSAKVVHTEETDQETKQKVIELVEAIDSRSFEEILRQINRDRWASTFYGLPRKVIEKLKMCVSKNAWKMITEEWVQGGYLGGQHYDRQAFLRVFHQLEEMGMIVLEKTDQPLPPAVLALVQGPEVGQGESLSVIEARWAEQKEKAQIEAKRWITEEIAGLI